MCSFCTRLIDSTPPPITTSIPSYRICLAAVAMAIIPEEHCRSILMPLTEEGNPPAKAAIRPMLPPVVPCCNAAPIMTSSTWAGSTPALCTASLMATPARLGAEVLL